MKNNVFININGDGNLININVEKSSKKKDIGLKNLTWFEYLISKSLKLIWRIIIGIILKLFIIFFNHINL